MNISDLADLVTIRNHINIVLNDKSVSSKNEFRPLNEARIKLDKKFIETIIELDFDNLFPNDIVQPSGYLPLTYDDELSVAYKEAKSLKMTQLTLPLEIVCSKATDYKEPGLASDIEAAVSKYRVETESKEDSEKNEDPAEAELAIISARVKAQKELLKKEGRSNKRISKAKEDVAGK